MSGHTDGHHPCAREDTLTTRTVPSGESLVVLSSVGNSKRVSTKGPSTIKLVRMQLKFEEWKLTVCSELGVNAHGALRVFWRHHNAGIIQ